MNATHKWGSSMSKKKDGLNPRQREFVRQYLISRNGTDAARKAGYKGNDNVLGVMAHDLLRNPKISVHISGQEKKLQEKYEITQERIIDELATVAFGHIGRVMDWDEDSVALVPKSEMDERDMKFIESIQITEFKNEDTDTVTTTFKVKTMAGHKVLALEKLGKHVGLWKDGNAGSGNGEASRRNALERIREHLNKRLKKG